MIINDEDFILEKIGRLFMKKPVRKAIKLVSTDCYAEISYNDMVRILTLSECKEANELLKKLPVVNNGELFEIRVV